MMDPSLDDVDLADLDCFTACASDVESHWTQGKRGVLW